MPHLVWKARKYYQLVPVRTGRDGGATRKRKHVVNRFISFRTGTKSLEVECEGRKSTSVWLVGKDRSLRLGI